MCVGRASDIPDRNPQELLSGTQESPGNKPQGKLTIAEDEKIEDDILETLTPEEVWIEH